MLYCSVVVSRGGVWYRHYWCWKDPWCLDEEIAIYEREVEIQAVEVQASGLEDIALSPDAIHPDLSLKTAYFCWRASSPQKM